MGNGQEREAGDAEERESVHAMHERARAIGGATSDEPIPLLSGEDEHGGFQDVEMSDVRIGDYVDGLGNVVRLEFQGPLVVLRVNEELALRGGPTRRVRTRPARQAPTSPASSLAPPPRAPH